MKMISRWSWALLALVGALTIPLRAAESATVKSDKVNVRGQALVTSEVVTQLQKGETVTILEEVEVKKPKKGEPARWLKIQLPANTPVWVYAPYVEMTNKTVNVSRVNLRSGPGENFSVLGRVPRGTPMREIRVVNNWMEVEAPDNAYAFVAAEYLERTPPAAAPAEAPPVTQPPTIADATPAPSAPTQAETPSPAVSTPPAEAPPPTVVTVQPDQAPAPTVDDSAPRASSTNAVAETPTDTAPPVTATTPSPEVITATTPSPSAAPAPDPEVKRLVSREGKVVISRSIQAPTEYALESLQTHRLINYLHSEEAGIKLKVYGGRKVIVSGEELIDVRWTNTPILEVQSIHLVP